MVYRYCFVFDLDECLVHVSNDKVYVRPYAEAILQILSRKPSCFVVLWSSGTRNYIYHVVSRLNWFHYFKKILTREDCEYSFSAYKEYKSCLYIKKIIEKEFAVSTFNTKFILIDDLALFNEKYNLYDYKIAVVPFTKPGPDLHLYYAIQSFI